MSSENSKDDNPLMTWLENGLKSGSGVSKHLVNNWLDWIKAGPAQDMGRKLIGQVKESHPETVDEWVRIVRAGVSRVSTQYSASASTDEPNQDEQPESRQTEPGQSD
ncbi:MAG: hypothetical protein VYA30_00255 [Myxococcota bacterium]|nr:hypothetical protein [Myxococcota bacterium]